jgi:hypothetical protein
MIDDGETKQMGGGGDGIDWIYIRTHRICSVRLGIGKKRKDVMCMGPPAVA